MSVDSYANRIGVYINLDNGTHLQTSTVGSPTGTSYKIEDYGNGWYRLSVTTIQQHIQDFTLQEQMEE